MGAGPEPTYEEKLRVLGGSQGVKTCAWGFAMVPHRLCVLVLFIINSMLILCRLNKYKSCTCWGVGGIEIRLAIPVGEFAPII